MDLALEIGRLCFLWLNHSIGIDRTACGSLLAMNCLAGRANVDDVGVYRRIGSRVSRPCVASRAVCEDKGLGAPRSVGRCNQISSGDLVKLPRGRPLLRRRRRSKKRPGVSTWRTKRSVGNPRGCGGGGWVRRTDRVGQRRHLFRGEGAAAFVFFFFLETGSSFINQQSCYIQSLR